MSNFYRPLSLWLFLWGVLLVNTNLSAQTYEISSDGSTWHNIATATAISVCPNTEYLLRITHNAKYDAHISTTPTSTSMTPAILSEYVPGSSFNSVSSFCVSYDPGSGAGTLIIARIKFTYSGKNSAFTISQKVSSSCAASSTVGGSKTYEFVPLPVAAELSKTSVNVCEGSQTQSVVAKCSYCNNSSGGSAKHQWYKNGVLKTVANQLTYNIDANELKNPTSFDLKIVTTRNDGPLTCVDADTITYTVSPKPSGVSAEYIQSNGGATTSAEICIGDTQKVTASATNGPSPSGSSPSGSSPKRGYEWIVRRSNTTGTTHNGTTIWSSVKKNSNEHTINSGKSGTGIIPHGSYDVLLKVTNDYGCTSEAIKIGGSTPTTPSFVVNDKPGVKIYHNAGDPSWKDSISANHTTANPIEICTGENLRLSAYPCNATDYNPNDYDNNNNNNTDPKAPNITIGIPQFYTSPCNGDGLFDSEEWTMKRKGSSEYKFISTGSNNKYTAESSPSPSPSPSSPSITYTPSTKLNYIEIRTLDAGEYTFTLNATGVNGCSLKDEIKVQVSEPTITFELNGDGTRHSARDTIKRCEGTENTITAHCDLCGSTFIDVIWDDTIRTVDNQGAVTFSKGNTIATQTDINPITTKPLGYATQTKTAYRVIMEDGRGCTTRKDPSGKAKGSIFIEVEKAPDVTAAEYDANLCDGDAMRIKLTGTALDSYDYEVYQVASGSDSLVYSCTTCAIDTTTGVLTLSQSSTHSQGCFPVNNSEYFIVAKSSTGGNCNSSGIPITDGNSNTHAQVGESPNAAPAAYSPTLNKSIYCNSSGGGIYLDSRADKKWTYTWGIRTKVPRSTGSGLILANSSLTGFSSGNQVGATFPASRPYDSIQFMVTITNNACKQEVVFPYVKVDECHSPILYANSYNEQGGAINSQMNEINSANPFKYVCENGFIEYKVDIGNPTSSYNYEWKIGNRTIGSISQNTFKAEAKPTLPDINTVSVLITSSSGYRDSAQHTFIISRGAVNFFPQGDNAVGLDTSICENQALYARASCPTCYGSLIYEWDYNNVVDSVTTSDGAIEQLHVQNPPNPLPSTNSFEVDLRLSHGERGHCKEVIKRQIGISKLPEVDILYNDSTTQKGPLYRCAGGLDSLKVNVPATSTVSWSTGATTPSIKVPAQGGYYAFVTDQNDCRGLSDIAIVVDAFDGYNSPVLASPSEICSGKPAVLQVPPCVGCSYQWYRDTVKIDTLLNGNIRIYSTIIPGRYFAEVRNPQGCVYATAVEDITTNSVAPPIIRGSTDTICANQQARLWTRSGTGFSYQWYYKNKDSSNLAPITGATDSSYMTLPSAVGIYQVQVTYNNGCTKLSSLYVLDSTSFIPSLDSTGTEICSGQTVDVSTPLVSGWQYQWYRNGIAVVGATGSVIYADSAGSYYALVTNYNGCVASTPKANLTRTELLKPKASTSTPTICPGETGRLSVSLCVDCYYEWFDITPTSLAPKFATGYNYDSVTVTGDYYAVVSKGACSERSDTVSIVMNPVFTPAINSVSSVVCNGRDGVLTTRSCANCSYHWLLDGDPALGALNDTFHIVKGTSKVGDYRVAIDYPNGCSDTSSVLTITDGSYKATIKTNDSKLIICNGSGKQIDVEAKYSAKPPLGTFNYTLFLNNNPITGASNINSSLREYHFTGNDDPGAYTVEVVDPNGCIELSNYIFLDTINVSPVISSRATSNPNSVPATAICSNKGSVYLVADVNNCGSCTYQWLKNGHDTVNATNIDLWTDSGSRGKGLYSIKVTNSGCSAISNPITIVDRISGFNNKLSPATASICDGQSSLLEYKGATCIGCTYRWLRTIDPLASGNPIGGANNDKYVATVPGWYTLELTTALGCVDTSNQTVVQSISKPKGLALELDSARSIIGSTSSVQGTGTPIAASARSINLNSWITPASAQAGGTGDSTHFSSAPYNAALNCGGATICNPGLSGRDSSLFTPADSLVGNHLITYHYYEAGCEFTVQDVLQVLPAATITMTNSNPNSVPYEACIGDDLVITAENLKFKVEKVYAFDSIGNYILMQPNNFRYDTITYGADVFYKSIINWKVPQNAYASYLMLMSGTASPVLDTIESPFLLIHNTDLSFAGLPGSGELCSNGERLTLFGNPLGGSFSVEGSNGVVMPRTVLGDSLYPSMINPALYNDSTNSQLVDVVYSYNESYTNGNACPSPDTVRQRIKVLDVRLTNVDYNPISVSQEKESLTNLVYRVDPYKARANKQDKYTVGFSGSFTTPAGAPEYFLPRNAGVGHHALTYKITSGTCTNSVKDSIEVVPAPADIAIPDTICRNFGTVGFSRHTAFPYSLSFPPPPNSVVSDSDFVHIMRVRGKGIDTVNKFVGAETFTYDPTKVSGNHDVLEIEYVFYRDRDTLNADFDAIEYVVASIVKPIYIEDLLKVEINDTVVQSFYCQDSALSLLTANPADSFGRGLFMLFGGTGQYKFGDTLPNSVINPYQVNYSENATTTYDLVYILNGVACLNSDTMLVTISKGLTPAFTAATNLDEFCDTDPAVAITHNVVAPDTAIWKIGGIPQADYVFDPRPLNPGIHILELQQIYTYIQATDTLTCSATATDTFTIHALPNISATPLDKKYCANDSIVDFIVSPAPDCPQFGAAGQYVLKETFDAGIPASWTVNTIVGSSWAPDNLLPQGGSGQAAFVDTSRIVENSWLVSPLMNMTAGHRYRLSYMVLAGQADPNCGSGCFASLFVGLGNSSNTTSITTTLDYLPLLDNDQAYVRYTVDYFHDPAVGAVTGQYHMGFRNFTPAFGRSLRLDNVEMRDLTVDSCRQNGIGYVDGPGTYKVQDSLYQFDPLSVPAGDVTVKYVYTNTMGCQDSVVFPITVDTAPVVSFTNIDSFYCENEGGLMLTGNPLGGTFTSTKGNNLQDDSTFATLSPAFYPVSYQLNTVGTDIVSYAYTDGNNCTETVSDTVVIVPLLDFNGIAGINTLGYGYCIVDSANILDVTNVPPLGSGSYIGNGTFYGPGVRNGVAGAGVATFHSDSAVIDMGHTGNVTLSYIFTTTTGCLDTSHQTFEVHASPDLSFVNLPDSLCLNADSFRIMVQNRVVTGALGQTVYNDLLNFQVGTFTETDVQGNQVPNFIQLLDMLYPYEGDGYSQVNISYRYRTDTALGACESVIYDSVRMDSVPIIYYQNLQSHYCENDPSSIFLAFPSFYVGSGYLLIDTLQYGRSYYNVDPAALVGTGQNTAVYPTYYTFTDSKGCMGEGVDTFEVRPYPRITFTSGAQDTSFCRQLGQRYDLRQLIVSSVGGYFTDNLALTSIRDSFYLDLGSQPGPRVVTYNYIDTATLCQNNASIRIHLFSAPELDFTAYGGCSQMDITFSATANNLVAGVDSITRIYWKFEGNDSLFTQLDTSPITIPDTTYQYSTSGTYNITLYVSNQGNCTQQITKPLIVSPYYNLANGDYFEDFNTGAGDWYDDQPLGVTPKNVWTYEPTVSGKQIKTTDGAWVTIADTLYAPGQSAWVYSPCFDFTDSKRPMIAFDLWRDALSGIDGAILEYYDSTNNNWERVGDVGEGINWYQSNFVLARPGNQAMVNFPRGWTGRSNGYESARLRLDQFEGDHNVRFRISFAVSPQTVIDSLSGKGYEGIAFDNVWVGERTRNVLVEHFSNVNYQTVSGLTSDGLDAIVYNKVCNPDYGTDVVLLQYQINDNSGSTDPIYLSNPADLGGRGFEYNRQPGEILINGRQIGTGLSENLDEWEMDHDMLQFPEFNVRIDKPITIVGNVLTSSATVEANENMPDADYILHMAIIQDSLTYNTRNFNMLNIVRKMEPDNTGINENHAWSIGQTASVVHSWDYSNQLGVASFNPDQLEVVVFIQNDNTNKVYQVATTQDMNRYNGTQSIQTDPRTEIFDLNVYPNPSSDLFNVAFDDDLKQSYNWSLVDVTGRTLQMGTAEAGTKKFTIDANRLVDGAYFFVIRSEDNKVYAQRKLIVIKR